MLVHQMLVSVFVMYVCVYMRVVFCVCAHSYWTMMHSYDDALLFLSTGKRKVEKD